MTDSPTLQHLQGLLRFKERELALALYERRELIKKVRHIKIEKTAIENHIAAWTKERVCG